MKSALLTAMTMAFITLSALASAVNPLGNYYQFVNGKQKFVAQVYSLDGQLKISFGENCIADLQRQSGAPTETWLARCKKGRGYSQLSYSARLVSEPATRRALLYFRAESYGDIESGFGGSSLALQR